MVCRNIIIFISSCLVYCVIGYGNLPSIKDLILSMIGENEENLQDEYYDTIVEVPENHKNKPSIDLHGMYGSGKYMNTAYFNTHDVYFVNRILNVSICIYLNTQHEEVVLKVICNCSINKICGTGDYHVLPADKWYCILLTENMAKQSIYNRHCNYTLLAPDGIINRNRHVFLEYYVNETEPKDDRYYTVATNNRHRDISVEGLIKKLLSITDEEELYSDDHIDYSFDIRKRSIKSTDRPTESTNKTSVVSKKYVESDSGVDYSSPSDNCKVYRKYINFRSIGLKWILHPPGIDYGYCMGECQSFVYTDSFLYSLLAFHYIDGIELKQCCSIQSMDDLVVHYRLGRTPKTAILRKVSVKSCKCI
ncbi:transforming growth factor beta [Fowlpox virus]|nr:transforming growth factor beta [Fowlpox virus]AXY04784.1 transforming growth factor beta [Fowlpox virus]